jgi:rhodanese-related sulfurtransferase
MIREISATEASARRAAGATIVDVREQVEWDAGHIPGAVFIPLGQLGQDIGAAIPD